MNFAIGQRWLSSQQPELGLGIVADVQLRQITIYFPITQEDKLYSVDSSPLIRLLLEKGDTGLDVNAREFCVIDTLDTNGLIQYLVDYQDGSDHQVLTETQLSHHTQINQPEDRLFTLQLDKYNWFDARLHAFNARFAHQQSPLLGLAGARVNLIEHQIHIANQVGNRFAPRVLLADEVGLGKTIEAAMIMQKQRLSGRASRMLIIVPESLIHQWLVEMHRRVNMQCAVFDAPRVNALLEDGMNPFDAEQIVLISIDTLVAHPTINDWAVQSSWDLIVVDEAHHLQWSQTAVSTEYEIVEQLTQTTPGVLLLTATPDQLGHESHFARLRLLDPARFADFETYETEQSHYTELATLTDALLVEAQSLALVGDITGQDAVISAPLQQQILTIYPDMDSIEFATMSHQDIINDLIDRHGTGRMFFRNTRHSIQGLNERVLHPVPFVFPEEWDDVDCPTEQLCFRHELPALVISWLEEDPRVQWLLDYLDNTDSKTLLICRSQVTVLQLAEFIKQQTGRHLPVFHEKMSIIERDRAAHYFADPESNTPLLLCSEIGSEGRNFQFAQHLILFDLPLHPDLLEQRIGRLDRIGQSQVVNIHVPYFTGSAHERLFNIYHQGLNSFNETCAIGAKVFDTLADEIQSYISAEQEPEGLIEKITDLAAQYNLERQQGRDKLLELSASGKGTVEPLLEALNDPKQVQSVERFMQLICDALGIAYIVNDAHSFILQPTDQLAHTLSSLPEDGLSITYRRDIATAREELSFISWDHPFVHDAIDIITSEVNGKASLGFMNNSALPAGAFFVECLYILQANSDNTSGNNPYLTQTPVLIQIDSQGNSMKNVSVAMTKVDRKMGQKLVPALAQPIKFVLTKADELAAKRVKPVKKAAIDFVNRQLGDEIIRLQQLQKVNPSISDVEIEQMQATLNQALKRIKEATLYLDAVRVVINNPQNK
ncbi:MAG: RNA polymerase-associated protein RapA [Glaciecola sp.]|nr:RNA polymerase-associated protein RapA [Glaciecola sp.]